MKIRLISLVIALPLSAASQVTIQRSNQPYVVQPEIKFVIGGGQPAPLATPPAPGQKFREGGGDTARARTRQAFIDALAAQPPGEPQIDTPAPAQPPRFAILASDRTVRDVLSRWAVAAGWVHGSAHWTIDKDHPIEGGAGTEMSGDFKEAVRMLLSSTDLTDRPVQPCFYTNRVVRVIPKASMCDKSS